MDSILLSFFFAIILAAVIISPLLIYISKLNKRLREKDNEILNLTGENSRIRAINESFDSYKKDIETINENSKQSFTSAAKDLFFTSAEKLTSINRDSVTDVLKPLKEQVEALKRQLDDAGIRSAKDKASLEEHIHNLVSQTQKIGEDAVALTKALKGDKKMQGNWGEALLDTILRSSGLKEGIHYFTQMPYRDDNGQIRYPDVVVKLPQEDSSIVIDSKVSLNAYVDYCNAEDDATRELALVNHTKAVRAHVDELAAKDYSGLVSGAIGFVLMFVANEPSYIAALQKDPGILEYARSKKVIIVSPANLMTALQLTLLLWKSEQQRQNISRIITAGSKIYDKFVDYSRGFEEIGKSLGNAQKAYETSLGRLSEGRGNLLTQMRNFKNLGLQPSKEVSDKMLEHCPDDEEDSYAEIPLETIETKEN